MTLRKAIGLPVCISLALITGSKLWKMCAIRGWLPGTRTTVEVINDKYTTRARRGGKVYWVAWASNDPSTNGRRSMRVDQARWAALSVGDEIEVCYVGEGRSPYSRGGIYASTGNFVVDIALFVAELGGAVFCALPLLRRKTAKARHSLPHRATADS